MFAPTTEGIDKMTISELMRTERIGYLEAKRRVETSEQMAVGSPVESTDRATLFGELVLMVDVFCACIETGVFPKHGSPCHRRARWMVDASGQKPKRKRRRLL